MKKLINIPPVGDFDYSPHIKTFFAFAKIEELGPVSFAIRCECAQAASSCREQVQNILKRAAELDSKARALISEQSFACDEAIKKLRLASIDCYVNGEFDFFYENIEGVLQWAVVYFSKDLEPFQIEFDL